MQTKTERRKKALAKLQEELACGCNHKGQQLTWSNIDRILAEIASLKRKLGQGETRG